jgi:anti-sigma B factor antagonist
MRFSLGRLDRIPVLSLAGELDFSCCESLDAAVDAAAATGAGRLIIDLTDVGYMDSPGFGCLVRAHRRLGGRNLAIVCPRRNMLKLMETTGMDRALCIVATLEEARGCFELAGA